MKVIIAAAGTAGHINPGLSIANKIKETIKKLNKSFKTRPVSTSKEAEEEKIYSERRTAVNKLAGKIICVLDGLLDLAVYAVVIVILFISGYSLLDNYRLHQQACRKNVLQISIT